MRKIPDELWTLYLKALAGVVLNGDNDKKLAELRVKSIQSLFQMMQTYCEGCYMFSIIEAIWEKKTAFILSAETKKDMAEILKPSVPYFDYCSFKPKSKFHVEEEELIFWSLASLAAPLSSEGFKRYRELFCKILPEQARMYFRRSNSWF